MSTTQNVTFIPATRKRGVRQSADEKPRLRTAAYCRVSTDRDEQELSYENQVSHFKEYIKSNQEWIFAGIYADEGISALNTKKRDEFNRMIEDALNGKIDLIITKSISRFARNTVDCLKALRELKNKGVGVFFEKEGINSMDPAGEVMITILASIAQQESMSIGKNVTLGIQYKFQRGQVIVNYNRFLGYTRNEKNGPLIIVPEEAEIVKRIFREYLDGKSWVAIARGLTADGLKNGAGNTKWHDSNIRQILTNEKYMGDALLQKTFTLDPLEKIRIRNEGDKPQYYVEGCHEAIIPKEIFMQVQEEMRRRSNRNMDPNRKRGNTNKYALSGKVFCGHCGDNYRRVSWSYQGETTQVWRCQTRLYGKGDTCPSRTVKDDLMQKIICFALDEAFHCRDEVLSGLQECLYETKADGDSARIEKINYAIEQLQERLVHDKKCDIEYIAEEIKRLRSEKQAVYAESAERVDIRNNIKTMMDYISDRINETEEYDEITTRKLVAKVTVFDDHCKVQFKSGVEAEVKL